MNAVALQTVGTHLDSATRRGSGEVRFTDVELLAANGARTTCFRMGEDIHIRAEYHAFKCIHSPEVWFVIKDMETGVRVTSVRRRALLPDLVAGQEGTVECVFESVSLHPRRYGLYFGLSDPYHPQTAYDVWDGATSEIVVSADRVPEDADFAVGYDTALVCIPHRLTHNSARAKEKR